MSETTSRGIQATLFNYFQDTEYFSIQEANELVLDHQNRDVNAESQVYFLRRNYKSLETVGTVSKTQFRDLSMFPDHSIDLILTVICTSAGLCSLSSLRC